MEKSNSKEKRTSIGSIILDVGAIALAAYIGFEVIDYFN
jgi:hypothetical protein